MATDFVANNGRFRDAVDNLANVIDFIPVFVGNFDEFGEEPVFRGRSVLILREERGRGKRGADRGEG